MQLQCMQSCYKSSSDFCKYYTHLNSQLIFRSRTMDKTSKYCLTMALLAVVFICSTQYVRAVALHSQGVPDNVMDGEENEDGKMHIITLLPSKVEFAFFKSVHDGIYVLSEVKDDSEFLLITTKEGEQLYMMDHSGEDVLYSVGGKNFFVSMRMEEHSLAGFTIPSDYHKDMKNAFKEHRITRTMLDRLDFEGANVTRKTAFEDLLQRAEVRMIVEAAWKLGNDMQVQGTEYPAAMTFYILAMRLDKYQKILLENTDDGYEASGNPDNTENEHSLAKRSHCWFRRTHCHHGKCCWRGRCPHRNNCLGLCGPGCRCWWWVCANCCYNQGCYDHDLCCGTNWDSWGCLVPAQWAASPTIFCTLGYWCYSDSSVPW